MRHFLSVCDFSDKEFEELISLGLEVKKNPKRFHSALQNQNIALVFMKSSTRTRVSFEVGINQMGGHAVVLSSRDLQLGRGETIADTGRVLSRYVDAIMARVFGHEDLEGLRDWGSVPIINGLSDLLHPCQAACDYLTLVERFGSSLSGCKLAYVGDGNNMAHSLMLAGAKLGVEVRIATPAGFEPDPEITAEAKRIAEENGTTLVVVNDPSEAVDGVNVVYTDVWASMGQEDEHKKRLQLFAGYQVDTRLFEQADPEAVFMHCLPAHRGEEVAAEVADHERSIIFEQAENRLHAQKALMVTLLGRP